MRGDQVDEMGKNIVFFDGTCGFCQWSVQFIYKYDRKERFFFAPLQGSTAKKILAHNSELITKLDTLVLVEISKGKERSIQSLRQFYEYAGYYIGHGPFFL